MIGADGGRKSAAPIDIGHEQQGASARSAMVRLTRSFFLRFRCHGTARPFQDDQVIIGRQRGRTPSHYAPGGVCARNTHGPPVPDRPTVHDHLGAHLAAGFKQDRIHIHMGRHARGLGLDDLSPTHFAALGGDEGIEGHVLGLEGGHPDAFLPENATQRRHQNAFTDIGAGA